MRDCPNAEMRDLLPDLLHEQGSAELRARVRSHLDSCEACRDELALLHRIRAAAPSPRIDTVRIATVVPLYATGWRRAHGLSRSPMLRIAAAVVLLVGGVTLLRDAPLGDSPDTTVAVSVAAQPLGELGIGDQLADLSEQDLRTLLSELGDIEAITSGETDVIVVPAPDQRGGA